MATFNNEVLVDAVVAMMGTKTTAEYPATILIKVLRAKAGVYKDGIPIQPNRLSRELNKDIDALAAHGITMTRLHSGTRSIKFVKAPRTVVETKVIKPNNNSGETTMETKTYKASIKEEVLTAIKEFGPITVADIAELTFTNVDSVRSFISHLKRDGENILSARESKKTKIKLYRWTSAPKEAVIKPAPVVIPAVSKPTTEKPKADLVSRAYYLTLALRSITADDLMEHLDIDEDTAYKTLIAVAKRNKVKLTITV